jgi:hypothetical protein
MTNRLTLVPVNVPGPAGMLLSATTGAQSLSGFTGIQFVNNGLLWIVLYIGSGGAGNLTQNFGRTIEGVVAPNPPVALTAGSNYLFGNWKPSDFTAQDGSGLTYFDLSGTQTANSVTLYQLVPVS